MVAALLVGAFGSLIGSFLNVVVYRVPAGRSIVSPGSACGSCGHAIRAYDNIPVLSWLILRGRCRDCRAAVSVRYPLVELGAGVTFAAVAWHFGEELFAATTGAGMAAAVLQLVAFLYLAAISLALALIDLDTQRLPNVIVLPAYAVGALLFGSAALLSADGMPLLTAGLGSLVMGGAYLALALVRPGAMGMGDVKLAGALGLFLGWLGTTQLIVGMLAGFILGGIAGIILLLAGRSRSTAIAFGPWLIAGAWIGVFLGEPIARGYLSLFGIT